MPGKTAYGTSDEYRTLKKKAFWFDLLSLAKYS